MEEQAQPLGCSVTSVGGEMLDRPWLLSCVGLRRDFPYLSLLVVYPHCMRLHEAHRDGLSCSLGHVMFVCVTSFALYRLLRVRSWS